MASIGDIIAGAGEFRLEDWKRTRDELRQELEDYKKALNSVHEREDDSGTLLSTWAEQRRQLEGLKSDLLEAELRRMARNKQGLRELLALRLSQRQPQNNESGVAAAESAGELEGEIERLRAEQQQLAAACAEVFDTVSSGRAELAKVQRQVREERTVTRELGEELERLQQTVDVTQAVWDDDVPYFTSKLAILSNVFLALILESGVDWADDPELAEEVLSLSRPLQNQK